MGRRPFLCAEPKLRRAPSQQLPACSTAQHLCLLPWRICRENIRRPLPVHLGRAGRGRNRWWTRGRPTRLACLSPVALDRSACPGCRCRCVDSWRARHKFVKKPPLIQLRRVPVASGDGVVKTSAPGLASLLAPAVRACLGQGLFARCEDLRNGRGSRAPTPVRRRTLGVPGRSP
jgi:hypothetical protein